MTQDGVDYYTVVVYSGIDSLNYKKAGFAYRMEATKKNGETVKTQDERTAGNGDVARGDVADEHIIRDIAKLLACAEHTASGDLQRRRRTPSARPSPWSTSLS